MKCSSYYHDRHACRPTVCCECRKGSGALPITYACPAGDKSGQVLLSKGLLELAIDTLSSGAKGSGGFDLVLHYLHLCPPTDSLVGKHFDFTHNVFLTETDCGVELSLGQHVTQSFREVDTHEQTTDAGTELVTRYSSADNDTSATLTRRGKGTANDRFVLISRDGTTSELMGFHHTFSTPGRLTSFADRFGNRQELNWTRTANTVQITSVVDSYGRTINFDYYGPDKSNRLRRVTDFAGRQVCFQYDSLGHLTAVVLPAIAKGADNNTNTFPNGRAYVFEYDVNNRHAERRDDLIRMYHPNQVHAFIKPASELGDCATAGGAGGCGVDLAALQAACTKPRMQFTYGQDPTDVDHYGKVIRSTFGDPANGSGGSFEYIYTTRDLAGNELDPADPIVSRTIVTDRNGNQTIYDFNAKGMTVRLERISTRSKNSLQARSFVTWTKYNSHNQPLLVVHPEGNSTQYEYEDENNTIVFDGVPYGRRIGLTRRVTRRPGNPMGLPSRSGSGPAGAVQTQLTQRYFHDPLFGQPCGSIEPRGNAIGSGGEQFPAQNGDTVPPQDPASRYATLTYLDYQKDTAAAVRGDMVLAKKLNLTASQIGNLILHVDGQMASSGLAGFEMGLGDVNGDGTGEGTAHPAPRLGSAVKVRHPSVWQLVENVSGEPWKWQWQDRLELYTSNARGQTTTHTDPEGNLTVYVRYPENDPEGSGAFVVPLLSNKQYGFLKEIHSDADPATVMSLVGSDGDLGDFIGNKIPRTNTPGVYQDLITRHQGGGRGGCSSCAYDALGNELSRTDARGFTTVFERNEIGQVYRVTGPAPYFYQVETFYDANGNVIRVDTQDQRVAYDSNDPTSINASRFTPTGSGSTAQVPSRPGPGGSVRPGWFTNLYQYDVLDNKIEEDLDATGSTPASLVTRYTYDGNQNLIRITKPLGNIVEYDYDERDLRIATRVGFDPQSGQASAVSVSVYDGNGNLTDMIGPADRTGQPGTRKAVILDDAFSSGQPLTHVGDWLVHNQYDGFDRVIQSTDAIGNQVLSTFDPDGRVIASERRGPIGGASPTDRSGSANVKLAGSASRFDEAGRAYETQQDVFLAEGVVLGSGRTVTHTGGGLSANSTLNDHTATATLSSGESSYVLSRMVYDRAGRTVAVAQDNAAVTHYAYDGVGRQRSVTDALGNITQSSYDANGNVIAVTRTEKCTIDPDGITPESFQSQMRYDALNRLVITATQGPDGILNPDMTAAGNQTIFMIVGYDSRSNRTNTIDPKGNTSVQELDGANRVLNSVQHLRNGGDGAGTITDRVTTRQFYDANSRLTRLIDSNGGTTVYAYDTLDRQTSMQFHDGSTRATEYNAASDVIRYTDENGSVFEPKFADGRSSLDALGRRQALAITPAAGVIGTTSQQFQFDGLGRTVFTKDTTDAGDAVALFNFDSLGRVVEEQQSYSGLATPRFVTNTAFTSYSVSGLAYPNGRGLSNQYDALYRRVGVMCDNGGRSITLTAWPSDACRGDTIQLSWSGNYCGNDTVLASSDGGHTWQVAVPIIGYCNNHTESIDTTGWPPGTYQLRVYNHDYGSCGAMATSPSFVLQDCGTGSGPNPLTNPTSPIPGPNGPQIAHWEFFGNRVASVQLGNGLSCSYMNDAQSHSAVQAGVPNPAWGDAATDRLGYDGAGRIIAKRFLDGGGTLVAGFTTAFDASSNKLFERHLHAEDRSHLYNRLDSLDRLRQYQRGTLASGGLTVASAITLPGTDTDRSYDLDNLGNWKNTAFTPVAGSPTTEIRQHNKLNEITQAGSNPVLYDGIAGASNGNITDDGTRLLSYDALNRLSQVSRKSDEQVVATYRYDALGRRVRKTISDGGIHSDVANGTTDYLYSGNQCLEERDMTASADLVTRQSVWGIYIDELIQLKTYTTLGSQSLAAEDYYPLADLLYRTQVLTDSTGSIVEVYDTDAYGNTLIFSDFGSTSPLAAPLCENIFTGRQLDPETGLYFYRARFYNTMLGRFVTRDFVLASHLYTYVGNAAPILVDPLGLEPRLLNGSSSYTGTDTVTSGGLSILSNSAPEALQAAQEAKARRAARNSELTAWAEKEKSSLRASLIALCRWESGVHFTNAQGAAKCCTQEQCQEQARALADAIIDAIYKRRARYEFDQIAGSTGNVMCALGMQDGLQCGEWQELAESGVRKIKEDCVNRNKTFCFGWRRVEAYYQLPLWFYSQHNWLELKTRDDPTFVIIDPWPNGGTGKVLGGEHTVGWDRISRIELPYP